MLHPCIPLPQTLTPLAVPGVPPPPKGQILTRDSAPHDPFPCTPALGGPGLEAAPTPGDIGVKGAPGHTTPECTPADLELVQMGLAILGARESGKEDREPGRKCPGCVMSLQRAKRFTHIRSVNSQSDAEGDTLIVFLSDKAEEVQRLAAAAAKSLQSCPTLCDHIDVRDLLESGKFLDFPGG